MKALSPGTVMANSTTLTTGRPSAQEWKDTARGNPSAARGMERGRVPRSDRPSESAGRVHRRPPGSPPHAHGQAPERAGVLVSCFLPLRGAPRWQSPFPPLRLRIRPGKFREPDLLLLLSAADSRRQNRSGSAPTSLWKLLVKRNRNGIWLTSGGTMPRPMSQNTGSSTRKRKPSRPPLAGDAYEEAGIYRRGESAASMLLAGFSVAVAAVFDAD